MITLERTPKTLSEWFEIYGDPREQGSDSYSKVWAKQNLVWYPAPFKMVLSWDLDFEVEWLWMHRRIGAVVLDALREVVSDLGEQYLIDSGWNRWGGCFNFRPQRGDPMVLSSHAMAAAVDINPHLGLMGERSRQPEIITKAFVDRGFVWGGEFKIPDGMHYQAGTGL